MLIAVSDFNAKKKASFEIVNFDNTISQFRKCDPNLRQGRSRGRAYPGNLVT